MHATSPPVEIFPLAKSVAGTKLDVMALLNWVKNNKLTTILVLIVLYLLSKQVLPFHGLQFSNKGSFGTSGVSLMAEDSLGVAPRMGRPSIGFPTPDSYAPTPEVSQRKVVQNSHLSLVVSDVASSVSSIKSKASEVGGYMVESNLARPQGASTGDITLRVPSNRLEEVLSFLRGLAVNVVSENLKADDVTDQYVDNEARLAVLERNKARFEEIMEKASTVTEILNVQQQIFNLQSQIDSIKGQQNYLERVSESSLVTVFLATDELSLPYAPEEPWRPEVIFRQAVRSLLVKLQEIGSALIWIAVYSVIWLPALVLFKLVKRRFKKQ